MCLESNRCRRRWLPLVVFGLWLLGGAGWGARALAWPVELDATNAPAFIYPTNDLSALNVTNILYLAARTDGIAGTGALDDPLDVSDAGKWDRWMSNSLPHTLYQLYPGIYLTHGSYDGAYLGVFGTPKNNNQLKDGTWLNGAGRDTTTLRLVDGLTNDIIMINANSRGQLGNPPEPPYENLRVSNLTLDGNSQNAGILNNAIQGIYLGGRYSHIFKVHALNFRGRISPYKEAFILSCGEGDRAMTNSTGNLLDHCEVSSFRGGPCTAIAIAEGGIVESNSVDLAGWDDLAGCYGAAKDVVLRGNIGINGPRGFTVDSSVSRNLTIVDNLFSNCVDGLWFNGFSVSTTNLLIASNRIYINAGRIGLALAANPDGNSTNLFLVNLRVFDNWIDYTNGVGSGGAAISLERACDSFVFGNRVAEGMIAAAYSPVNLRMFDNRTFAGEVPVGLEDNFAPPAVITATAGGGNVTIDPPGPYLTNTGVAVTAVPSAGWSFLRWKGALSGTNASTSLPLVGMQQVEAVFGTAVSAMTNGPGAVELEPATNLHPFASIVRVKALPSIGQYFSGWTGAAAGITNPFQLLVTNPAPVIGGSFDPLPGGKVSLVALPSGNGSVTISPSASNYDLGTMAMLQAVPDPGAVFLGWGGDATGNQNPLTLMLSQSMVITALFGVLPPLSGSAMMSYSVADGLTVNFTGNWTGRFRIEATTNLSDWVELLLLTNQTGNLQFADPAATGFQFRAYRAVETP